MKLTAKPPNTPAGNNVHVFLSNGVNINFCHIETPGYTVGITVANTLHPEAILGQQINQNIFPRGYAPKNFYYIGSTADFRNRPSESIAQVCIPDSGLNTRLFQLQIDPVNGLTCKDITTTQSGTMVCGNIGAQFQGIVVSMVPIPHIPSLTEWGMILLILLMGTMPLYVLKKSRSVRE